MNKWVKFTSDSIHSGEGKSENCLPRTRIERVTFACAVLAQATSCTSATRYHYANAAMSFILLADTRRVAEMFDSAQLMRRLIDEVTEPCLFSAWASRPHAWNVFRSLSFSYGHAALCQLVCNQRGDVRCTCRVGRMDMLHALEAPICGAVGHRRTSCVVANSAVEFWSTERQETTQLLSPNCHSQAS